MASTSASARISQSSKAASCWRRPSRASRSGTSTRRASRWFARPPCAGPCTCRSRSEHRGSMETLAEKVAVVTGGASGIGLALARAFLDERMKVVIADVEEPALQRAVGELREKGDATGVVTDVTDPASVGRLADTTFDAYGACHVLCN